VQPGENEGFKWMVDTTINGYCKVAQGYLLTDPFGKLEKIGLGLYQQIIDSGGKVPVLTDEDKLTLSDDGYVQSGGAAMLHVRRPRYRSYSGW
jgi:hypothetical protein